jgi:hypothetical protein
MITPNKPKSPSQRASDALIAGAMNDESNVLRETPEQLRELAVGLIGPAGGSMSDRDTSRYIMILADAIENIASLTREKAELLIDEEWRKKAIDDLRDLTLANATLRAELDAAKVKVARYDWLTDGNAYEHADDDQPYISRQYRDSYGNNRDEILSPEDAAREIDTACSRGETGEKIG